MTTERVSCSPSSSSTFAPGGNFPTKASEKGHDRLAAAPRDSKRDQQQACQRKPGNRVSQVLVGHMELEPPGFGDAARRHWRLQIDVERRNPIPPERLP